MSIGDTETGSNARIPEISGNSERDSRKNVLEAFNYARKKFIQEVTTKPADQLLEQEKEDLGTLNGAFFTDEHRQGADLKHQKFTYTNKITDPNGGPDITQEEGLPVEGLISFLETKLISLRNGSEKKKVQQTLDILKRKSQTYEEAFPDQKIDIEPGETDNPIMFARKRQEAEFVSQDQRATGSEEGNYTKALRTLRRRRMLIVPPKEVQPTSVVKPITPATDEQVNPIDGRDIDNTGDADENDDELTPTTPAAAGPEPAVAAAPSPDTTTPAAAGSEPTAGVEPGGTSAMTPSAPRLTPDGRIIIESHAIGLNELTDKTAHLKGIERVNEFLHFDFRKLREIWKWPSKIGVRLGQGGAISMEAGRARAACIEHNIHHVDMLGSVTPAQLAEAKSKSAKERKDTVGRFKEGNIGSKEQQDLASPELTKLIRDKVIMPIVHGVITDDDQIRKELSDFVLQHLNDPTVGQEIRKFFGPNRSDYGTLTEYFATDLLEMGKQVKEGLETYSVRLEQYEAYVDNHYDLKIHLGTAAGPFNEDIRTTTDKLVAHFRRRKSESLARGAEGAGWLSGAVLNPVAVAIATSVATEGVLRGIGVGSKALTIATLGTGLLAGMGVSAYRRTIEIGRDYKTVGAQATMGATIESKDQVRQRIQREGGWKGILLRLPLMDRAMGLYRMSDLEELRLNSASAQELLKGGGQEICANGGARRSAYDILHLLRANSGDANLQKEAARRMAEIQFRFTLGQDKDRDLITFSNKDVMAKELRDILSVGKELRTALQTAIPNATQFTALESQASRDWMTALDGDAEQKAKDFTKYTVRSATGSAVFAGTVGAAGGAAVGVVKNISEGKNPFEIFGGGRTPGFAIDQTKELYDNGGKVDINDHITAQANPDHSISLLDKSTGQPILDQPKIIIQADGHLVATGSLDHLPGEIKNWPNQEIGLRSQISEAVASGQPTTIPVGNANIEINGSDVNVSVGNNTVHATVGSDATLHLYSDDLNSIKNVGGELVDNGFPEEHIIDRSISHPSVLNQIKEALAQKTDHQFSAGPYQVDVDGATNQASLSGNGIDIKAQIEPNGQFVVDSAQNPILISPGADQVIEQTRAELLKAGFTDVEVISKDGGTVLDQLLNHTADELKSMGITETDQFTKDWNFHTHHDLVKALGFNTHNELRLNFGQFRGNGAPLGEISFNPVLSNGPIPSNLPGIPALPDHTLGQMIDANKGLINTNNMFGVVDLNDGRQIMIPFVNDPASGMAKFNLPEELLNRETNSYVGIKSIAGAFLDKSDGIILTPTELGVDGQIPQGTTVHSLASEVLGTETPTIPPEKILKFTPPDISSTEHHYAFDGIPPHATEIIPPPPVGTEAPPFIPIPFAPRHPLEPLRTPEGPRFVYTNIYRREPNPEQIREFEERRSPRLRNNRNAELNASEEINWYFEQQNPQYVAELNELNNQIGQVMDNECRLCVTMPVAAHQEEANIYKALENYANQQNRLTKQPLDRKQFEILIFLNRPADKNPDGTESEINRFMADHPDVKIRVAKKIFRPEEVKYGRIVKYLADLALLREKNRDNPVKQDVILVTNDADSTAMSRYYIQDMFTEFDKPENKQIDGILGKLEWSQEAYDKYPVIHAATRFAQFMDVVYHHGDYPRLGSSGGNFALKSSIYAAIGGYFASTGAGADQDLSRLIRHARVGRLEGIQQKDYPIKYLNKAWLESNPRRGIDYYKRGMPIIDQWDDFNARMKTDDPARLNRWQEITSDSESLNDFNVTRLESEVNAILATYGMDATDPAVARSLTWMGVKANIVNGKLKITDTSKLMSHLRNYKDKNLSQLKKHENGTAIQTPSRTTQQTLRGARNQVDNVANILDRRENLRQLGTRINTLTQKLGTTLGSNRTRVVQELMPAISQYINSSKTAIGTSVSELQVGGKLTELGDKLKNLATEAKTATGNRSQALMTEIQRIFNEYQVVQQQVLDAEESRRQAATQVQTAVQPQPTLRPTSPLHKAVRIAQQVLRKVVKPTQSNPITITTPPYAVLPVDTPPAVLEAPASTSVDLTTILKSDTELAASYWSKRNEAERKKTRETIVKLIQSAMERGNYIRVPIFQSIFVNNKTELTDSSKELLAAYKEVAKSLGLEIGEFNYIPVSSQATAEIHPISQTPAASVKPTP